MVGSTILLSTSNYPMLFSFVRLEKGYIFTFLIYFRLPLGTSCGYCYIDECLIEELAVFCNQHLVNTFRFSDFTENDIEKQLKSKRFKRNKNKVKEVKTTEKF
ncbi:odorant receptor 13a-like [Vespula squamosa]|uniref:Odorant receptor 13a-like n=1 Tax=Vespula squamosa TaxID=30214 RepID=A0ABD2BK24_VESSQ